MGSGFAFFLEMFAETIIKPAQTQSMTFSKPYSSDKELSFCPCVMYHATTAFYLISQRYTILACMAIRWEHCVRSGWFESWCLFIFRGIRGITELYDCSTWEAERSGSWRLHWIKLAFLHIIISGVTVNSIRCVTGASTDLVTVISMRSWLK